MKLDLHQSIFSETIDVLRWWVRPGAPNLGRVRITWKCFCEQFLETQSEYIQWDCQGLWLERLNLFRDFLALHRTFPKAGVYSLF